MSLGRLLLGRRGGFLGLEFWMFCVERACEGFFLVLLDVLGDVHR